MKQFILILLIVGCSFSSIAQKRSKKNEAASVIVEDHQQAMNTDSVALVTALRYNDVNAALSFLYRMIAEEPNNTALRDSLASLYFSAGAYQQCVLVSKDILEKEPKNLKVQEMLAISYQSLGALKESLETYEDLYKETKSVFHAYQLAVLQYSIKRFLESAITIDEILANGTEQDRIQIYSDQNTAQTVDIKAAAYNLKGNIQMELKESKDAIESFNKALELEPDFELAKANLENVKKQAQEVGESAK